MIQGTRQSIKVVKNLTDTQQFIVNESNRLDMELEDIKHEFQATASQLTHLENTCNEYMEDTNTRLDDHHDELQDQATAINNMKNVIQAIVAGRRLQLAEPTNGWAIAAI